MARLGSSSEGWWATCISKSCPSTQIAKRTLPFHCCTTVSWIVLERCLIYWFSLSEDCCSTNCLEAACLTAKHEDLRSVSTGGKKFLPRKCNDKFCTQLTKAYAAKTSCISCYWFCYVPAHDQFTRLRSVASSRRCRSRAMIQSQLGLHSGVLKIVTRLTWEHIPNANICVGASRSYPFVFVFITRITCMILTDQLVNGIDPQ